ncbi:hypothetical protein VTP01DRAFT_794 [Rhizomucor pusillus]|uniref:uncharacterized protein n=1 Tax=Rhizomucor pusillus TaxID=4840 RepID=UPI003743F959
MRPYQKAPLVEVKLPERDARILETYERRAKKFDEMIKLCCCWIGYDALLDLIPVVGKVISLCFSLSMYRLACQADLPKSLRRDMLYHVSVDFVLGLIPILGVVLTMLYRANMKNARMLRRYLYKRAREQQQIDDPVQTTQSLSSPPPPPPSSASSAGPTPPLPPRAITAASPQ